jgi:phosphatidate cytidylyltransferase
MALNNFGKRALFGAVYVLVLTSAAIAGGWWFFLLCLLLAILCLVELFGLAMPQRSMWFRTLLLTLSLPQFAVIALSEWVYLDQTSFPGSAMLQQFLLFWESGIGNYSYLPVLVLLLFSSKTSDLLRDAGVFALSLLYILLPLSILAKWNEILILYVFILTWSSDTFAYLGGKAFGKHKLFERVSPGKTWEGFFSGLAGTVLIAWVYSHFRGLDMRFVYLVAPAVHIAGTLGDLTESLMKRNLGVKDSGNVIPGHGGILDRLDAMLFIIPVVAFMLRVFETPCLP